MQWNVQHPVYGEVVYTENIWTGKKKLTVNGMEIPPVSKKEYMIAGQTAVIEGNYLTGLRLCLNHEIIEIVSKPKWYETALAVIPFVFILVWGNVPSLCAMFPIVGGAIGGAIGGIAGTLSLLYMKEEKTVIKKVLVGFGALAAAVMVAYIAANLIVRFFY